MSQQNLSSSSGPSRTCCGVIASNCPPATVLPQQAINNSKEQFANSPDLTNEIMNAIIDARDVQVELSSNALNSAEFRERLKGLMLNQLGLYEKLKSRAIGA